MKVFQRFLAVLCLTVGFTVVFSGSATAADDDCADLAVGQPTMEEVFFEENLDGCSRYEEHEAWSRFFAIGQWAVDDWEVVNWIAFANTDGNVIFVIDRPFNEKQVEVINSTPVYERDRCWKHSSTERYWLLETDNGWMDNPAAEALWHDPKSVILTDWILAEVERQLPFVQKTVVDQYLY